ncbi:hypothetical protein LPJ75_006817, partial [Coemansia sp. RSA 2598]
MASAGEEFDAQAVALEAEPTKGQPDQESALPAADESDEEDKHDSEPDQMVASNAEVDADGGSKAAKDDQDTALVPGSDAKDAVSTSDTELNAEPKVDADERGSQSATESDVDDNPSAETDQVVPSTTGPSADGDLKAEDTQDAKPDLDSDRDVEDRPGIACEPEVEASQEEDSKPVIDDDQLSKAELEPDTEPMAKADAGTEGSGSGDHEHDSDDFVHISQLASGNESKDDISLISDHESNAAEDTDKESQSVASAAHSSVSAAAAAADADAEVAVDVAAFDMSTLEHLFKGASVESIVSYAIGGHTSDSKATSIADPQAEPEAEKYSE